MDAPNDQSFTIEHLDPRTLAAHPANWRTHPKAQRDALGRSLARFGWLEAVVWNKATGRLLDGHARVEQAIREDMPTIPVRVVDLSEQDEREALAVIGLTEDMAERDDDKALALLEECLLASPDIPLGWDADDILSRLPATAPPPGTSHDPSPHPPPAPKTATLTLLIASADWDHVMEAVPALGSYYGAEDPAHTILLVIRDAASHWQGDGRHGA